MKPNIISILFLFMAVDKAYSQRVFVSAPKVFHVGVKEQVFVQMESYLNQRVQVYMEHETSSTLVSQREEVVFANRGDTKTVEIMINNDMVSRIESERSKPVNYLLLVVDCPSCPSFNRKTSRVLISKRRGYIFIQTDQPMYNPTQEVKYRIFTLDHTFKPHNEVLHISVINAVGNRVMTAMKIGKDGIIKGTFPIPDVSKMGTWKIRAHYEQAEAHAVFREFKVQKFVLPSFEVNIAKEGNYVLLTAEQFNFTISANYLHGETVTGAYHCQFGVIKQSKPSGQEKPVLIMGLELTGSVHDGRAEVSQSSKKINAVIKKELNQTLSDLQQSGVQLYIRVFVTNIQSGEIQDAEKFFPVVAHKYTMDLSRTRSYFLPGYPLDVVVIMRLPDGSPAAGVPIKIDLTDSSVQSSQRSTDQEGAVYSTFNVGTTNEISVEVTADDLQQKKTISRASSPSNSYLYISLTNKVYSVKELLTVTYNTINSPGNGFIYYMVLSRGIIVKNGSLPIGNSVKTILSITHDMVPSFRLIGFFYMDNGDIVADSVWVDVKDECEIKVKIAQREHFRPGTQTELQFDLDGQRAQVALLAVDKAFYALKADNKLTDKQVFSAMQSYDLGCSYGGGRDTASVLGNAGLAFASANPSQQTTNDHCDSRFGRPRRSVDIQVEMMSLKSNFSDELLQDCCAHGVSLIPMTLTCQERAKRISLLQQNETCAEAFLKCCLEGQHLRQKKIEEEARKGLGRTVSIAEVEEFFMDTAAQYIRRYFPPSFAFTEFEVNNKKSYHLSLPDSITTWELQVMTLSAATGFCVVKPPEIKAFKEIFVSMRLPYSVKKHEQLSISPIIYNYRDTDLMVAVHMEQTEGLCSPGSATNTGFVNITVKPQSSQFVSFSAVPMVTGSIPIKIRLYDIENEMGIDAIEKILNVWSEGVEKRIEDTKIIKFEKTRTKSLIIDGSLPEEAVPESAANIFVSVEENGFGISKAMNLLSPEKVARLIVLPTGCCEQTMSGLAPTAAALRYLDLTDQWFNLPVGSRDDALDKIEKGFVRVASYRNPNGSYGSWNSYSNWLTAYIVKVLSLIAQRQTVAFGEQGRQSGAVPIQDIRRSVNYLLTTQNNDGFFSDPYPVYHKHILTGTDQRASLTAFVALALHHSLQFLPSSERSDTEARILRATSYLMSNTMALRHPYAVAITAYCLSVCLPEGTDLSSIWTRLEEMATESTDNCSLWTTDKTKKQGDALTIETTAYALLTAVALKHFQWADKAACWLLSQERYSGGFRSTQDTIMALEALAEYDLKRLNRPEANLIAEFSVQGRGEIIRLTLDRKDKVETNLKKLKGKNIHVQLSGKGESKMKIVKAYQLLDPKDKCEKLSISVTVEGKVKYTAKIINTYEYYGDYEMDEEKGAQEDDAIRSKRDVNDVNSDQTVTYKVCVSHSLNHNLTGMAIADITLLSGFEVVTEDLDKLKRFPEQYISHYEVSYGRVLLYYNQLLKPLECISFDAVQRVPIGLLQPAPAVFYDYYDPDKKCTVFYSAPKRSRMVSTLCSDDVCQCAERPCHVVKKMFLLERNGRKQNRAAHACFYPTVDYAFIVEVDGVSEKSNFELYNTTVIDVLRSHGDPTVTRDSFRVFAKRRQCKEGLQVGKQYLIMGKDGSTKDSNGHMQYLLESNTWVEIKPSVKQCSKSAHRAACRKFHTFVDEYKLNGCRQ
ncbi:complement C4-B isoform X2 [Echeneis naucrates]|uniref:complement C4-B isoform X2 n=1 Tax=Echeneis naucrates TaxID=173247 RepID=UPI0011145AB2|nr:complement C4-A-like isoform X2 [Echeneis naucrates]